MAILVKHPFESAVADGADDTLVQPSDWNAGHTITLAASRLVGRHTGTDGAAEEIELGAGLAFVSGKLVVVEEIFLALSAEDADLVVATDVGRLPFTTNATITGIFGFCQGDHAGAALQVDANIFGGATILSTKLTIDAGETSSLTAATAAVISSASVTAGQQLSFDVDVVGSSTPGKNLVVGVRFYRT